MNQNAVLVIVVAFICLGCGVGRHVQKGINAYNASNYLDAKARWIEMQGVESEMNPKGHMRYLVYRGLTHFRLGERNAALHFLTRGNAEYRQGNPNWLPQSIADNMGRALAELKGAPPAPAPQESSAQPIGPQPAVEGDLPPAAEPAGPSPVDE